MSERDPRNLSPNKVKKVAYAGNHSMQKIYRIFITDLQGNISLANPGQLAALNAALKLLNEETYKQITS